MTGTSQRTRRRAIAARRRWSGSSTAIQAGTCSRLPNAVRSPWAAASCASVRLRGVVRAATPDQRVGRRRTSRPSRTRGQLDQGEVTRAASSRARLAASAFTRRGPRRRASAQVDVNADAPGGRVPAGSPSPLPDEAASPETDFRAGTLQRTGGALPALGGSSACG